MSHAFTLNSLFGLSDIQFTKGDYATAIANFKTCYQLYNSKLTGHYKRSLEASLSLAQAYDISNHPDSAYQYLKYARADALHTSPGDLNLSALSRLEILLIHPMVLRLMTFHAEFLIGHFSSTNKSQNGKHLSY